MSIYNNSFENMKKINIEWEKLKNTKILVAGANGLIASTFIDCIMYYNIYYKYNISIYALCRNEKRARKRFANYSSYSSLSFIYQDVTEELNVNVEFDYIIHAACSAHPMAYSRDPVGIIRSNVIGTMNLLEYSRLHNVRRLLFISSSEVYGENTNITDGFSENDWGKVDILNPRSCYSESKRLSENILINYNKQYETDSVIARPGHIYGAAITEENSRADAQFLRNAINGQDIVMKSAGTQKRSYCYVMDAVAALLIILIKGKSGEAYNIANKNSNVTIREYAETLAKINGVEIKYEIPQEIEKQGYSIISNYTLKSEKIEQLDWFPLYDLTEGIKEMSKICYSMKGV